MTRKRAERDETSADSKPWVPKRLVRNRPVTVPARSTELLSLLLGSRRPLRLALERLCADSHRANRAFRRLILHLGLRRSHPLMTVDLQACYRLLASEGPVSAKGDEGFCRMVERAALTVMRAGLTEGEAIAVLALHLEAGLASLQDPRQSRALMRLTSVAQGLVAAAYCESRLAGLRSLDDRERQKASGDLHDEVGAHLIVLKLYLEMIVSVVAKGHNPSLLAKLNEALDLIAHAVEAVRRLTLELGPAFLDTLGFLPVLRNFVRQFSQRTGIKVTLHEPTTPIRLSSGHEAALYRVLMGALSNVAKHSKARHAIVTLHRAGSAVVMVVEDDGRGFDVKARVPEPSFGLNAMKERVQGLDGRLTVRSWRAARGGQRKGTRVEVRLPLRNGPSA